MADEKINFVLSLDNIDFLKKGVEAKGVIESIANKENMSELVEALIKTTPALAAIAIAAYSVKKAFDFTLEAESIQRVEKQFDILTEQAGISGEALKEGLEKSSKGLVDTSDLLEVANKKIVAMGSDASRLPEIMDLATKASQVFGGSVVDNFDELSTAIANGNTRMLKHKGILVDAQKALQDYAAANGLAVNEISEAGKRQAILNAALEQGQKAFAGVDVDLNTATNTLQLLKVTLKDLGEAFSLVFEKTLGPTVRSFLVTVKDMAVGVKSSFQAAFGDGLEKNTAQISQVESKIKNLSSTLAVLKAQQGTNKYVAVDFFPSDTSSKIQSITDQLKKNEAELGNLKKARQSLTKEDQKGYSESSALGKKSVEEDKINQQIRSQNFAKYQADIAKADAAGLKLQEKNIKTLADIDKTIQGQKLAHQSAHEAKIQELENATYLNHDQKIELIAKEEANYQTQIQIDERETATLRKQLLDNYVKNSTDAFDGIGRAFKSHAEQAKMDFEDMGKLGEEVFSSIQSSAVSAFEQMGAAMAQGQNAAEAFAQAMLKSVLGAIANEAIAEGSKMLLMGFLNPVYLAPGAGLLALGGALKAAAGGISGGVSIPSVSGASSSGGSIGTHSSSAATANIENNQSAQAKTTENDQAKLLADAAARNDAAEAQTQTALSNAAQAEQERQKGFAEAALQSQKEAQDAITAKMSDQATAQAALKSSTTPDSSGVSQLAQDQQLADTASQSAQRQKVVHINIAGNLFNTSETQRQLMEMIRNETDATGFEYNKIGV